MPAAAEQPGLAQSGLHNGAGVQPGVEVPPPGGTGHHRRLRFAVICASNMNRSMSAHEALQRAGFKVESFGVGAHVKLPGPSARQPNIFSFGMPYKAIHEDLMRKDPDLYLRNGLLPMLERNMRVKSAPQRWQESKSHFDVVVTFEERVMEATVEHLVASQPPAGAVWQLTPVLVVNMDIKDSADEAAAMAPQALKLCAMIEQAAAAADGCWDVGLEQVLDRFQEETGRMPLYTICWY